MGPIPVQRPAVWFPYAHEGERIASDFSWVGLLTRKFHTWNDGAMTHEPQADPFDAAPRPYSATDDYLAGAYTGPALPRVAPACVAAVGLGGIGLVLSLLYAFSSLMPAALQLVGRLALFASPVLALAAIVLGHVSFVQAERAQLRGKGQAVAGFLFGYASLIIVFVALVLTSGGSGTPGIV